MRTIRTGGTDIHIEDRPNGGYIIRQGRSYLMATDDEAARLGAVLRDLTTGGENSPPVTTPAKARMLTYRAAE